MNKDSSIRWQEIRIKQLGYVNYLLILVASGILTFQNNIWLNRSFTNIQKISFNESNFFFFVSIVIGIILAVNRLFSFRNTAKIARLRGKGKTISINQLRKKTDRIDCWTWILLYFQLFTFLTGVIFLFFTNFFFN